MTINAQKQLSHLCVKVGELGLKSLDLKDDFT